MAGPGGTRDARESAPEADGVPEATPTDGVPPVVTMTLWDVPTSAVPLAVGRMAWDRRHLARTPGLRFAKLLGTGDGRTFALRDAEPRRWGLLAVWDTDQAAERFSTGPTWRGWDRICSERMTVRMQPVASRGRWSGREPFGAPAPRRTSGPVAAITRARLRLRRARAFYRAVPPVSADLATTPGLLLAVGIGEAPIGLQGTFSLWADEPSLVAFAHHRAPHREVVQRTVREGWYAEELFARFRVVSTEGELTGRSVRRGPGDPARG